MIISEEDYLMHYGILRKSGRYPWGSGQDPEQRSRDFLGTLADMRSKGMSDADIAKAFHTKEHPFTTTDLRAMNTIARAQKKAADIGQAETLRAKGLSNVAIGERMGIPESSVRGLLAPGARDRADNLHAVAGMLKKEVEEKKYIDVGGGVENQLGISDTKLRTAISILKEEGYKVQYLKVPQLGTGHETTVKVLTKPDVPYSEVFKNRDQVQQIQQHTYDSGRSWFGKQPPISVDSSRLGINYAEHGGDKADGVIYVRPGVEDVTLGHNRYAQVRVAIDGTHYLKGMAIYKDDLPDGVDLMFNTNKHDTGNKLDALKELKRDKDGNIDKDNPFGALYDQLPKIDEHGNPIEGTVRSAMNLVNEEGKWDTWSRTLSTQFLSKQSPSLARDQLDLAYERKKMEFDEIASLTNPVVRRKLLESFADDADSSSVHMKAAALPRQRTQVLLPITKLKETEVYAPNFNHGEKVVLVRHPHGGKFEIPELTVNNRNPEAKRLLGNSKDAIGINHEVAKRLSGADFDGDTVLVVPNNSGRVHTERALEGLKNFDPQAMYPAYDGMKPISPQEKQHQMGMVSNLITDMTIRGASNNELAAAVRHSMVVIDAEKHNLDYKRSARDNGIPALMKKYQPRDDGKSIGGSSTLISRAKSPIRVAERKARPAAEGGAVDRTTGRKMFVETGASYVNAKGKTVQRTTKISKLAATDNAHTLSSGTPIEKIYAEHSNRLKDLANQARKEVVNTKTSEMSKSAKEAYAPQVKSLNHKLNIALQNAPRERQAQILANSIVAEKKAAYPEMDKADLKKIKAQALAEARVRTGAGKERVDITDDEWSAIQAGAISTHKLTQILNNSDLERIKELATPRTPTVMTAARQARAKQMLAQGYTQAEVADQLGVALSTLKSSVIK